MDAPPPDVMTAILRGGPYDRLGFEIDEGTSVIDTRDFEVLYSGGPLPPNATYKYSGSQDERGNAIFEVVDD